VSERRRESKREEDGEREREEGKTGKNKKQKEGVNNL
jgi:hypothetical protein